MMTEVPPDGSPEPAHGIPFSQRDIAFLQEEPMISHAAGRSGSEQRSSRAGRQVRVSLRDAEVRKEVAVLSSRPSQSGPILLNMGLVARTISLGGGTSSLCCPDCQEALCLFQPQEDEPSRLIGTCPICSKWVLLVEIEPAWSSAALVELPTEEAIHQMLDDGSGMRH
jgi:hypothetical protein